MGNRTRTLTFVRRLSGGLWSESQFFNFSKSVQQVVSDSKFGFPFLKHRRYLLNVGLSSILAEGALRVVRSHGGRRSQLRCGRGATHRRRTERDDPDAGHDRFSRFMECLLQQKGTGEVLRNAGIDLNRLRLCLEEYCRKLRRDSGRKLCAELSDRLRSIVRDNQAACCGDA